MNQNSTPKSQERFVQTYDSTLDIKRYDSDNLYPNNIMLKVGDSATASGCLSRYIDFMEGNGITSKALSAFVANRDGQTLDDIHALVCGDEARFSGFALLVQYDILCHPCGVYCIPFEQCRLEECDADGNVAHVVVHPDWSGKTTRDGDRMTVDTKNVLRIDVFNPDPAIVAEQMRKAGGITNYLGQVYYHSDAGYMTYPKPIYDSAITDISTDTGISNVMNRNVRSNFYPAGVVTYFDNSEDEYDELGEKLQGLQGDLNAGKILAVSIKNQEEKPEFTSFAGHNYDKDFTVTSSSATERIYSAFGQEGWYCLRIGKIGFSGDLVRDVELEYSKRVKKYQRKISRAYYAILSRFADGVLPEMPTMENLSIEPYASISTNQATL